MLTPPDIQLLATLTALFLFALGLLLGWVLGKNHRRQSYHRLRDRLEQQAEGWRGAYRDALGRLKKHPF